MAITDDQARRLNMAMPVYNAVSMGDIVQTQQNRVAANQPASTAETDAELVTDFNALLAKLQTAGLMEISG